MKQLSPQTTLECPRTTQHGDKGRFIAGRGGGAGLLEQAIKDY